MPYTALLATDAGVVLRDYHAIRLQAQGEGKISEQFSRFVRECTPGVWSLWSDDVDGIRAKPRPPSRLFDGMPVRMLPSPVVDRRGSLPKPESPGIYDAVRTPGTATLLTSADGTEIYESCSAAVISWDGERIVCVPRDRPRVWSTAEAAIRDHFSISEKAISSNSSALLLINAVKRTCALSNPFSHTFPNHVRADIEALFEKLTKR